MYYLTTYKLKSRAMLCSSLTVLLAACGGGSGGETTASGTQTSDPAYLSSVNANPKSNGYVAPTTTAPTTTTSTTTAPTTTTSTTTAPTTTTSTTTAPTTTTSTTTTSTTITTTNNYYVATTGSDSNSGTQSAPFRTIMKAASVVKPDTTVHVAPGTYAETITTSVVGSASARIRYVSDTKWGAKIVPVAGANTIWRVEGGYTDIDGFQIDGTGNTSVRTGIALHGGNSSVKNSWLHNLAENSGCDSAGGSAINANQYRGITFNNYDIVGNLVHDIGGSCNMIHGIYHASSGTVKNNIVYHTNYAIHMYHDDHNIDVVNNTLFANHVFAIVYGGCYEAQNQGCPTSGINIHNNIIYDNDGAIAGPRTDTDTGINSIKNNIVFGNAVQYDMSSHALSQISGTISANPQFIDYNRLGGGNYRLQSTSPAIDKGISTYAPSTDIAGTARPRGAGFDIGAYEY